MAARGWIKTNIPVPFAH